MTRAVVTQPYDRAKRVVDVVVATVGLIALAPVNAVVALLVARHLGRPVLFRQWRAGRHGEPFRLIKFRTMVPVRPSSGMVSDADRLTPFGRKLRRASLDELPTLWNVLRGDMSLVGPRPLLMQYLHRYSPEQARRLEVRPGITGLVQVSGRNALSWGEKFALDVEYVDRRSIVLDARILGRTVVAVLGRRGVSADGEATMPEFIGSSTEIIR